MYAPSLEAFGGLGAFVEWDFMSRAQPDPIGTPLAVITPGIRLGYIGCVSVGVLPSLFMLATRVRQLAIETVRQADSTVHSTPRAEDKAGNVLVSELVRQQIDFTEADLKRNARCFLRQVPCSAVCELSRV